MGDEKVYQLPKSGLRLVGETLSRLEGDALIADHAFQDLHEVVIRTRRDPGVSGMAPFFGAILAAFGAGMYFWAWRKESVAGWVVCICGAFVSVVFVLVGLTTKTRFLVLRSKAGEVVYPLTDDPPVVDAFFAEIREHAHAARLIVGFRNERGG